MDKSSSISSLPHGNRKFYALDNAKGRSVEQSMDNKEEESVEQFTGKLTTNYNQKQSLFPKKSEDGDLQTESEKLLRYIHENVIGRQKEFVGPFGRRKVEYCDYTASGRSLAFIEDYIREHVLSDYGNTHTTTSVCSLQTTLFRHEARDIIRNSVNAGEHDSVIFEGSGCTGAIHKLIHSLDLTQPPIVIVSPYEHHSNLLPWREMGSKVIRVREAADGTMDLGHLEKILKAERSSGRQVIGAFAAASNVTGILVDVNAVSALCHTHKALVFWDYATAAPYVHVDMNPVLTGINPELVAKDAIFISVHKFVGGVQTPGVLIAKKKLFRNPVPYVPGGGSVFFVRREAQRYLQEVEMREEGGTPAIVESIRAGLVFQLKEAVTSKVIEVKEDQIARRAFHHWHDCANLRLLGSSTAQRLPVFSFLVRHHETGLYLHHNYICVLLNDLFGIQARGGCACAGPYAEDLLGIDEDLAQKYEEIIVEDSQLDRKHLRRTGEYSHHEILRPGFVRLNIPYFMEDEGVDFILEAVKIVSEHGWKLLPQYNFNPETGEWRHREHQVFRDRTWLGHVTYKGGHMTCRPQSHSKWIERTKESPDGHADCLKQAREILDKAAKVRVKLPDQTVIFGEQAEKLRWFLLPSEAYSSLQGAPKRGGDSKQLPFQIVSYPRKVSQITREFKWDDLKKTSKSPGSDSEERLGSRQETFRTGMRKRLQDGYSGDIKTSADANIHEKLSESLDSESVLEGRGSKSDDVLGEVDQQHGDDISLIAGDVVDELTSPVKFEFDNLEDKSRNVEDKVHINAAVVCLDLGDLKSVNVRLSSDDANDDKNPDKSGVNTETIQTGSISGPVPDNKDATQTGACPRIRKKKNEGTPGGHSWHAPPKMIFKPFVQAIEELGMIKNGDRVLACLSGGKDSLSMLHSLHQYQYYSRSKGISFDVGAVTIDPQTSSYDPSPLKAYLRELGVPYFYEEQDILETAQNLPYECASICSFCSRMKRGRIYHAARREGYNVLALGQHLDDVAESFLMSVFHNGNLRTMKACYPIEDGDLRVIRPFVYVRETDLRTFAEQSKLPVISENCPACFEAPKERHRMKQLLAAQEILHPRIFSHILTAIKPILTINQTRINISDYINPS